MTMKDHGTVCAWVYWVIGSVSVAGVFDLEELNMLNRDHWDGLTRCRFGCRLGCHHF